MTHIEFDALLPANPLDKIEDVATAQDWAFDRSDEDELDLIVAGAWGEYPVAVSWRSDMLHVSMEMDVKVPRGKRSRVAELLVLINENLLLGHFDLCSQDGVLLFRYGLLLRGSSGASHAQCEDFLKTAVAACDRFYPAFQFLIWADRTAQEAFDAAAFETKGQA